LFLAITLAIVFAASTGSIAAGDVTDNKQSAGDIMTSLHSAVHTKWTHYLCYSLSCIHWMKIITTTICTLILS